MKNFSLDQINPTTEGSDTLFLTKSEVPVSAAIKKQGMSLDEKIAARKARDPAFEERLKAAAVGLLPLAQTDEGKDTVTSLRLAAGLTQTELARLTNSKQPNISALEAGQRYNPNRETMHLLCQALKCDMNTLDDAIENSKAAIEKYVHEQEAKRALAREQGQGTTSHRTAA